MILITLIIKKEWDIRKAVNVFFFSITQWKNYYVKANNNIHFEGEPFPSNFNIALQRHVRITIFALL